MHLLLHWIVSALVLLLVAYIVPGFRLKGVGSALVAVLVIALLNATLGFLLKLLLLPFTIVTFGLFLLVINAIILKLAAALLPGFSIRGFLPAVLAAVLLSLVHLII